MIAGIERGLSNALIIPAKMMIAAGTNMMHIATIPAIICQNCSLIVWLECEYGITDEHDDYLHQKHWDVYPRPVIRRVQYESISDTTNSPRLMRNRKRWEHHNQQENNKQDVPAFDVPQPGCVIHLWLDTLRMRQLKSKKPSIPDRQKHRTNIHL